MIQATGDVDEFDLAAKAVKAAGDAILCANAAGEIVLINPASERLFCCPGRDLLNTSLDRWFREDVGILPDRIRNPRDVSAAQPLELILTTANGSTLPVEISISCCAGHDYHVLIIRDISACRRSERVLALLHELDVEASSVVPVDRMIQATLDRICRFQGWPVGHAYLVEGDHALETIRTSGIWHTDEDNTGESLRKATGHRVFDGTENLPGRVLETGRPVWIPDLRQDRRYARLVHALEDGLVSAMAFPVVAGRNIVAVLEFFASEVVRPSEEINDIMASVGAQLGRVIERRYTERALSELNLVLQNALEGIARVDAEGVCIAANRKYAEMAGYAPDELIGMSWRALVHEEDLYKVEQTVAGARLSGRAEIEARAVRKNGTVYYRQMVIIDDPSKDEQAGGHYCFVRDVTDRKVMEEKLVYDAYHDLLTDLPNRASFMEAMDRALSHAKRRKDYRFAVVFVDLDDFKLINDRYGHSLGDRVLKLSARRLEKCLRVGDIAARLGGDEFAVLLDDIHNESDADVIAQRILKEFSEPCRTDEGDISLRASIGIALSNPNFEQSAELLNLADKAMYRAKQRGKGRYEYATAARSGKKKAGGMQ